MNATGTLFGIGAGPGAPDLMTLRGLEVLRAAPVLAYPAPERKRRPLVRSLGDSAARNRERLDQRRGRAGNSVVTYKR